MERTPETEPVKDVETDANREYEATLEYEREAGHEDRAWEPFGEQSSAAASEIVRPEPEAVTAHQLMAGRSVEQLDIRELRVVAATVLVDGVPLRRWYDSHDLNEAGLRHIVAEHLQGHDIKELLARELLEQELRFERDPTLGDQAGTSAPVDDVANDSGQTTIAGQPADKITPEPIAVPVNHPQISTSQPARRGLDYLFAGVILVLALVILALLLGRG